MGAEGVLSGFTPPLLGGPTPPAGLFGTKDGDLLSNLGVSGGGLLIGLNPWYPGGAVEVGVGVESQNLLCLLKEVTVEKACPHL